LSRTLGLTGIDTAKGIIFRSCVQAVVAPDL
jgi:hypothetical protein